MPFNATGAFGGAASGAAAGSAFGPIGTGIGALAGGLLGGFSSSAKSGQAEANAMNMALAERQMAFQRETMQNYHQWEVEDLRKAGLNPILSATHGSVGQPGAQAHMESDTKESSAQENAMRMQAAQLASQLNLNSAAAQKARAETMTEGYKQENIAADTDNKKGTVGLFGTHFPASKALSLYNSAKGLPAEAMNFGMKAGNSVGNYFSKVRRTFTEGKPFRQLT